MVADDSVFLPLLLAQLSEAPHIMSLLPGLKERGLQYLQTAAHANGLSHNCIEVIGKGVKQLTMDDIQQKKVEFSSFHLLGGFTLYVYMFSVRNLYHTSGC